MAKPRPSVDEMNYIIETEILAMCRYIFNGPNPGPSNRTTGIASRAKVRASSVAIKAAKSKSSLKTKSESNYASSKGSRKSVAFTLPPDESELELPPRLRTIRAAPSEDEPTRHPLLDHPLEPHQLLVQWSHFNSNLGKYHEVFRKEFPGCIFVRMLGCGKEVRMRVSFFKLRRSSKRRTIFFIL